MSLSSVRSSVFRFLDISVEIQADESQAKGFELLSEDFENFQTNKSESPEVIVQLFKKSSQNYFLFPFIMTPKWAAFGWFGNRTVFYSDQSVCARRVEGSKIILQVQGATFERAREIAYYATLSTVGELLEKKGYYRLHAGALQIQNQEAATVLFGLSGTGKSSMIYQAVQDENFQVLGDEMIFYKEEKIFSFPLRISLSQNVCSAFGLQSENQKFGSKKYLFPIPKERTILSSKIQTIALLDSDAHQWATTELSFLDYISFCFKIVTGLHLPQMTEYFLRLDNLLFLIQLFFRRLKLAFDLMKYSLVDFRTGKDPKLNYQILKRDLFNIK